MPSTASAFAVFMGLEIAGTAASVDAACATGATTLAVCGN
jgi:hypothetical protein